MGAPLLTAITVKQRKRLAKERRETEALEAQARVAEEEEAREAARGPTTPEEAEDECVVCHDARKEAAFFPCGHRCVCLKCAGMLRHRKESCPICRTRISQYARIYDT